MITFGEFIAMISLCIASFSLGYKIGHDMPSKDTEIKQK